MRLEEDLLIQFVTDLREAYRNAVADHGRYAGYVKKSTLIQHALNKPAKCFYVSYDEATRIIYRINRYGVSGKKGLNAIKFQDLYRAYQHIIDKNKDIDIKQAIRLACDSPAPRFYMCPDNAIKLLNKYIGQ